MSYKKSRAAAMEQNAAGLNPVLAAAAGIGAGIGEELEAPAADQSAAKAPEGYKVNPMYIETRSKRLQVVLQPSLYEKVKAAADAQGVKVNSYIHAVLEKAVDGE